jgi:hypothetical protein
MFKRKLAVLLVSLCVLAPVCSAKIAERIGKWRVEVGPAGNEFYQPPEKNVQPPSEAVMRYARIFVPHIKVTEWEWDDDEYEIRCERGDEEYQFNVTPDGELTELQYENDETDVDEEADELVLRGTKKSIAVSEVPKRALATLAEAYPNLKPSKTWRAKTIAGPRYVITIGEMAFYARPDGQIQAGRRIDDGGLSEIYPPGKRDEKTFKADLEKLLGPYRQRFNFQNQIKKLGKNPKSADGSYRYVVMGDNRSQWELWSNMVKHIDGLEPKPAFVINSGDIVPKGYARELREYYIPPLLKTDIPFFVAIGNHETGDDDMAREFRYLFGGKKSLNYYFDYGKARYVFFDNASDASSAEKTLKWLDKTLADTPKGYRKYVTMHKPPTTIKKWAYHAWEDEESKVFTELMTKHKVAEVYLGHIHAYSTAKHGGVNYTISGGAGAGLHNRYGPEGNVHHYIICDVSPDGTVKQRVVRFYDTSKESNGHQPHDLKLSPVRGQ